MKVLVVEPGYAPYEKDIEGLHGMQEVVGGTITAIYPFAEPVAVVGNDDSISLGMPFNRSMEGGYGGVVRPVLCLCIGGGSLWQPDDGADGDLQEKISHGRTADRCKGQHADHTQGRAEAKGAGT